MNIISSLIISLILLIISSLLFTESIEAIGNSLKFTHSFTGAIISPLFTSVPELIVIALSIIEVGGAQGYAIASGTVIGEPFMVSSLGFSLLSLSFILGGNNFKGIKADSVFSSTFIMLSLSFPVMLIPVFLKGWLSRVMTVLILSMIYILMLYFYHSKGTGIEENKVVHKSSITVLKLIAGFIILLLASDLLIKTINSISLTYRIDAEIVSILVIPIGTILPETMNSIVWAFRGKIDLAIGALIGEELLFATFYPIIGIVFTAWDIDRNGTAAVLFTSIFSLIAGILMWKRKAWKWILLFSPVMLVLFLLLTFY